MKKLIKRVLVGLLIILVLIQFFRPQRNLSAAVSESDITKKYPVPQEVQTVLKASCYDCHSNNTVYPWYANIQPVAWWLDDHVKEGKREVNFSEFGTYAIGRQYRKLDEINQQIKEDEMPLKSYVLIHRYAILTPAQKLSVQNWANGLRAGIKANYPADSLTRKKM